MTVLYARYVSYLQQEGSPAEHLWLDHYAVDSFSGWLHVDRVSQYGFPIPERPADALCSFPDEEQEGCDAQIDAMQSEWWQEDADGVVLGITQQSDSVMSCDHFTWFRIPLGDIAQHMRASGGRGRADCPGFHRKRLPP